METYAQIHAIDLQHVPVMTADRTIPRKQQALLARQLFKRLGIKGVSVTAPNYSMAQSVDVRVPSEPRPSMAGWEQYEHSTYSDMPDDCPCKAAHLRQCAARDKLEQILARAFPQHDNRSDYQSDHFDYCWSLN